jgi:hypothetical protein
MQLACKKLEVKTQNLKVTSPSRKVWKTISSWSEIFQVSCTNNEKFNDSKTMKFTYLMIGYGNQRLSAANVSQTQAPAMGELTLPEVPRQTPIMQQFTIAWTCFSTTPV